ncbi:MAG TPA: hypothetical protein VKA19_13875 [Alphaproteobacteria bacterium]|nr:hypothetical protein [Alphaproteobacteria bacterium]
MKDRVTKRSPRARRVIWRTLLLASCMAFAAIPGWSGTPLEQMTPGKWQEDLAYFSKELPKRHARPFANVTEKDFRQEVAELKGRLGQLKNYEVMVEFMRLAALLRDSHTDVTPVSDRAPFVAHFFAGQLYIVATGKDNVDLLGCEIKGVAGLPITNVVKRLIPIIDRDNEAEIPRKAAAFISYPQILAARGIGESAESIALDVAGGGCARADTTAEVTPEPDVGNWVFLLDQKVTERPLYQQRWSAGRAQDYYWARWLSEWNALYLQYNTSRNQRGKESFNRFSEAVLDELERRKHPILIVDLRYNAGGNFELADRLVEGLGRKDARPDQVFVLTSRDTGSAATVLAAELVVEHGATVVGELSRSNPNFTYNAESFHLPNSGLAVGYSESLHQPFPQLGDRVPVDLNVETTFEDYVSGRDPVLKAVFGRIGPTDP